MMEFRRAFLFAINYLDEQTFQQLLQRWREEPRDPTISVDDNALDPDVARVLREHGCSIEQHHEFQRVIFPQGTMCEQYLVTSVPYCLLTLPDGLRVKEIGKPNRQYSLVFIVEENHAGYPNTTY